MMSSFLGEVRSPGQTSAAGGSFNRISPAKDGFLSEFLIFKGLKP